MKFVIVDRRKNGKNKSSANRQKFLRRVRDKIRETVKRNITDNSIEDITNTDEQNITISSKDISEPRIIYSDSKGVYEGVLPGNKDFVPGDLIPKPRQQSGRGSGSGHDGGDSEQEDDFQFMVSYDEYMDVFFEDLKLPDLVKKDLSQIEEVKNKRAGFSVDGTPSKLNYVRSLKQSVGRRAALRNPKKKQLKQAEELLSQLEEQYQQQPSEQLAEEIQKLKLKIEGLKRKIKAIPFIDTIDLRYNRFEQVNIPSSQAVMFCIMDVSGSMGEYEKDLAKRFFMLLYLFLHRNYKHIDVVFVKHHTEAYEVDEDDFFYSRETGGTRVSSATTLVSEIIQERYDPSKWNIYVCQASDGDNDAEDCSTVVRTLKEQILPVSQYYAYVQVNNPDNIMSRIYQRDIVGKYHNFAMTIIEDPSDIFPVFRKLFEKSK